MTTRHTLVGERVHNPSRQQIRKIVGKAHKLANFQMKPDYLYTVVRAISARVNQNYDGWPSDELQKAAHTFVGKPVFVNHENFDTNKARGVVVAARYVENGADKYIETVMEIDAKRFPILASEIKSGGLDSVSMGAEAGFTICSACGNQAYDEPDMCDHVKFHKGEMLNVRNRRTGKVEEKLIYESCHKLSFFELSYVFDPADETAVASKVVMGARKHVHGSDCPPGDPNCSGWNQAIEDPTGVIGAGSGGGDKATDSSKAATPDGGVKATDGGKSTSGGADLPQGGEAGPVTGLLPGAQGLKDLYTKENPSADIGGYNPNVDQSWDEHATGKALDYMNPSNPDQVKQEAFDNGANYVLWQQQQWNPDGSTSPMDDRGSPTENHMDHMHINVGSVRTAVLAKLAGATDDYLKKLEDGTLEEGRELPTGPATGGAPSKSQQQWLQKQRKSKTANLKEALAVAIYRKLAFGEVEAPPAVDTLREEGSAPEDDNDDFHHYVEAPPDSTDDFENRVDSPADLRDPDLSEAAQIDREQEETGNELDDGQQPGENPGDPSGGGQFMELKIPVPSAQPPAPVGPPTSAMPMMPPAPQPMPPGGGMPPTGAPAAPPAPQGQVPMQAFGQLVSPQLLNAMEAHYGYRLANWRDAIEADRDFTPEEQADYIRQAAVVTLENSTADSPTSRNPVKGTANMARSTLATRRKTAGTQHFAEGPLTDGGDVSRNDQGEQEEAFIVQTPSPDSTDLPDDDETNISNTEGNLVADEAYAHSLTATMRRQQAALEATAREYARVAGVHRVADEYAGGPTATEVNPTVPTSAAEELTGDDFTSADPDPARDTSPGGDGGTSLPHESSLQAFRAFDKWLTATTKKGTRQHSEANIKKAASQFANYNGIPVQAMFPALGIALRQARKTEAALKAKKGSTMRKRAVDLETAAPDERVSVPAPVADTTDAEAQASQFHEDGYANNAGDQLAKPDQSTGQNFAPGQAPGKSAAKADGILAIRCAEAMIAAGLEDNTRERKYQLAAEFSKMSRGLILDRTALAERFAMVRHADRQKVASGSTRGAARSPIPAGLTQGGTTRSASTQRVAENNPDNDALLYG